MVIAELMILPALMSLAFKAWAFDAQFEATQKTSSIKRFSRMGKVHIELVTQFDPSSS
jgi:hypothetical protein